MQSQWNLSIIEFEVSSVNNKSFYSFTVNFYCVQIWRNPKCQRSLKIRNVKNSKIMLAVTKNPHAKNVNMSKFTEFWNARSRNLTIWQKNYPDLPDFYCQSKIYLSGSIKKQNTGFWSLNNPQWIKESYLSRLQKGNV